MHVRHRSGKLIVFAGRKRHFSDESTQRVDFDKSTDLGHFIPDTRAENEGSHRNPRRRIRTARRQVLDIVDAVGKAVEVVHCPRVCVAHDLDYLGVVGYPPARGMVWFKDKDLSCAR